MIVNDSKKSQKVSQIFCCEFCHYNTSIKCDYTKHLRTDKHKNMTNDSKMVVNDSKKSQKVSEYYICDCGKKYKFDSGYYRHKKVCTYKKENLSLVLSTLESDDLIIQLIKQNDEFKQLIIDQNKNLIDQNQKFLDVYKNNISQTTIINSNNKTFNLNLFLNETCKDAMNISDFVNSIKLQLSDLEKMGEIGYIDGLSNIIVKNLKCLDVTQRPIHCTDPKSETMYIKDENKWEKEDDNHLKLRKVIKNIAYKNTKMLHEFKSKHPDCGKSESKYSDKYNKLVVEAMGGRGDNNLEKENKIIRKIAKEVTIEK